MMSPLPEGAEHDAIADGIQVIKVVRANAAKWGISLDRILFVGFSGGAVVTSAEYASGSDSTRKSSTRKPAGSRSLMSRLPPTRSLRIRRPRWPMTTGLLHKRWRLPGLRIWSCSFLVGMKLSNASPLETLAACCRPFTATPTHYSCRDDRLSW